MVKEKCLWYKTPFGITIMVIIGIFFLIGIRDGMKDDLSSQTTQSFSRIQSASQEQIEKIEFGLADGITIREIYTIKSRDFSNVYFVGGLISGSDVTDEPAIWATGGRTGISMILSVNAEARVYSDYPDGSKSSAEISVADEGVSILRDYLNSKK